MDWTGKKSGEIETYLKKQIRLAHGNAVEDAATVKSSHGTYYVNFESGGEMYSFSFKRKSIDRIAKAIRALK